MENKKEKTTPNVSVGADKMCIRDRPYSQTYLKTLHNQLSAIFNHAVRQYELRSNPAAKVGNMGSEEHKEMLFLTKEEYKKFSFEMKDKPVSFYAFEMLYWCGIREGELLGIIRFFSARIGRIDISDCPYSTCRHRVLRIDRCF